MVRRIAVAGETNWVRSRVCAGPTVQARVVTFRALTHGMGAELATEPSVAATRVHVDTIYARTAWLYSNLAIRVMPDAVFAVVARAVVMVGVAGAAAEAAIAAVAAVLASQGGVINARAAILAQRRRVCSVAHRPRIRAVIAREPCGAVTPVHRRGAVSRIRRNRTRRSIHTG